MPKRTETGLKLRRFGEHAPDGAIRFATVLLCLSAASALPGCSSGCPPEQPELWATCVDGNETSAACRIVLPRDTGALGTEAPFFTCDGFESSIGGSACDTDVEPTIAARGGRTTVTYPAPGYMPFYGSRFELEYGSSDGEASARFCRVGFTDVDGDPGDGCPPADWECARTGSVTLNEVSRDDDPDALLLEFSATFDDGATVQGAF